jgi:hypothetical protein
MKNWFSKRPIIAIAAAFACCPKVVSFLLYAVLRLCNLRLRHCLSFCNHGLNLETPHANRTVRNRGWNHFHSPRSARRHLAPANGRSSFREWSPRQHTSDREKQLRARYRKSRPILRDHVRDARHRSHRLLSLSIEEIKLPHSSDTQRCNPQLTRLIIRLSL